LLGLAIFTAEQRKKEIGVRKVIRVCVIDIVTMLSSSVIQLVIISSLIAAPMAWLIVNHWLQGFAYRIHLTGWIFLMAIIITLTIALVTISLPSF
jgi:putative ABC transport system permease protein